MKHVFAVMFSIASLATSVAAEDVFSITASNGIAFDQDTRSVEVKWAKEDSWSFSSMILGMRIEGFRMGDDPVTETDELVPNNTGLSFMQTVDGERMFFGCRLDNDTPVGWVKRTELTDTRVSGSFRVELSRCVDGNTAGPIDYDQLPIIVEGTFSVDRKG
jgi:hypothetical protein